MLQTERCSPDTMIATSQECSRAKAALDPKAPAVKSQHFKQSPKGCSRFAGLWFFNTHETGTFDGVSKMICKASTGKQPPQLPELNSLVFFLCLRFVFGTNEFIMNGYLWHRREITFAFLARQTMAYFIWFVDHRFL